MFLSLAIEGGSRETVRTLLCYGADPLLHDYSGKMPIDLAEADAAMRLYLVNLLADLHGRPPTNSRGAALPPAPVQRWSVAHAPEFHDPARDPRLAAALAAEEAAIGEGNAAVATGKRSGDASDADEEVDCFIFEAASQPLPTVFQFADRGGEFVVYRELKDLAKRAGHHKADIRTRCDFIEVKKSDFLRTAHCRELDRRSLAVRYHEREEEDTLILVRVDKYVRRIFRAEYVSIPRR
jgi:hypothetical protein